jgi:FkbM family methyltransferase
MPLEIAPLFLSSGKAFYKTPLYQPFKQTRIVYFYKNYFLFYSLFNWYSKRRPFPKRGLKYFQKLLIITGNRGKLFQRKIHNGMIMELDPFEHIQKQIFWYGHYEQKQLLCWEQFVQPHFIVADIGANVGLFSLVASAKIESGKVYAFEPGPVTMIRLQNNIQLNYLQNIKPVPFALSDRQGSAELFISTDDNTGMSGLTEAENFSGHTATIEVTTADAFFSSEGIKGPHLVKMDIEGGELNALVGMKKILRVQKPVLFIEICQENLNRYERKLEEIYELLYDLEYEAFQILEPNMIRKIKTPIEDELVIFLPKNYTLPAKIKRVF